MRKKIFQIKDGKNIQVQNIDFFHKSSVPLDLLPRKRLCLFLKDVPKIQNFFLKNMRLTLF